MNKKKSLQNNYHMKKSGYRRAHFERCNLLTSSKLFARRFNVWSSRQLSISLTRAKWLWARLKCWSLERQDKPCREKKSSVIDSTVLLREYGLPIGLLSFFAQREPSFKVVAQFEYCRSSIREASSITTSSVSHYLGVYELIVIHE